jgi:hypothetical protein
LPEQRERERETRVQAGLKTWVLSTRGLNVRGRGLGPFGWRSEQYTWRSRTHPWVSEQYTRDPRPAHGGSDITHVVWDLPMGVWTR